MSSNIYYINTVQYENLNGNTIVTYYSRNEQDSKVMAQAKKIHKLNAENDTTKFVKSFFN